MMVNGHISSEDLALYAMQALSPEEMQEFGEHITGCSVCKQELAAIHGDLALLALSVPQEMVPDQARARLMARVAATAKTPVSIADARGNAGAETGSDRSIATRSRSTAGFVLPWTIAAALACGAGYFAFQNQQLQNRLEQQAGEVSRLEATAQRSQQVLDILTSSSAQRVTLTAGKAKPAPTGRASYLPDRGALVFIASNLNPLPANKTYELWIIPANGKAPVPVGLFHPDASGSASVILPTLQAGIEAKAFGVTIENPEGAAAPTMPIVLAGS